MMPSQNHALPSPRIIWIDLEMTGLDPVHDRIIELATIVTDNELNIVEEGPELVIYQPEEVLEKMDEWNVKHHTTSGLLARVRASDVIETAAEKATINFLKKHIEAGQSPMAGNSICQDRRFLARYMPALEKYFHYRQLDVSTVKELAKRWKPSILSKIKKESRHRALDDIRDAIKELRYYRETFFKEESA